MNASDIPYEYKPLDELRQEIRLLKVLPPQTKPGADPDTIECELINVALITRGEPAYEAISYTWGDGGNGIRLISLEGSLFPVRNNVYDILQHFRLSSEPRHLWIDTLCINQRNVAERNDQVSRMHTIFDSATHVRVWLGPENDDCKTAIAFIKEAAENADSEEYWNRFDSADLMAKCKLVVTLFANPYWRRMWIVQEYLTSNPTLVYCGEDVVDSETLKVFQEKCIMKNRVLVRQWQALLATGEYNFHLMVLAKNGPSAITQFENALQGNLTFFDAVELLRRRKATDPRDMIFAIRSMFVNEQQHAFPVDYNRPVAEVFTEFTTHQIQKTNKLDCWAALPGKRSAFEDMPSWAIDWTEGNDAHVYFNDTLMVGSSEKMRRNCNAALDTLASVVFPSPDTLVFRGMLLDTIDQVCPEPALPVTCSDQDLFQIFARWCDFARRFESTNSEIYVELTRTLLIDVWKIVDIPFLKEPEFYTGVLNTLARELTKLDAQAAGNLPQAVLDSPRVKFAADPQAEDSFFMTFVTLPKYNIPDRKLFNSARFSALGIGPQDLQQGDMLVLPFGCNNVMLLRPGGNETYTIVGPCYLHGFMQGEALELHKDGRLKEDFYTVR